MNIKCELRRIAEKYNLEYTIDNSLREKLVSPKDVEKYIDELKEMLQRSYNVEDTAIIKSECGVYLRILDNLVKNEEYLKEAVDYYTEKGSLLKAFINKIRLAHTYQWQKEFKKSDKLFEGLLAEMGADGTEKYESFVYQHYGKSQFAQGNHTKALSLFTKAMAIRIRQGEKELINSTAHAIEICQNKIKNEEVIMEEKEKKIRLWFDMWIDKKDYGIKEIFSENIEYVESWGPRYNGTEEILEWFSEWNRGNCCTDWEIRQFFHKGSQTAVEWYFRFVNKDNEATEFDGMTLVNWDEKGRILFLKEFKCDL